MNIKIILILIAMGVVVVAGVFFLTTEKEIDSTVVDGWIVQDTSLPSEYISTPDNQWPPEASFLTGDFSCEEGGDQVMVEGEMVRREIKGNLYCVSVASEGAAGSTYTTYVFSSAWKEYIAKTMFVLRFVQCENYDEPKKGECKGTQGNFDPYLLGHNILMNAKTEFSR